MKTFYVYIVKCDDNTFYTGITNDLQKRIAEHNAGIDQKSYTYTRRPVKLVFSQFFHEPDQAVTAEKQIKGWSRKKKEALIQGNWKHIHQLAMCRNETSHVYYKKSSFDSAQDDGSVEGEDFA